MDLRITAQSYANYNYESGYKHFLLVRIFNEGLLHLHIGIERGTSVPGFKLPLY